MFEREKINYKQYVNILATTEKHFLDFKDKSIAPKKISKTVSAFANTDGGELFIGIREEGENDEKKCIWQGFEREEEANGIIQVLDRMLGLGGSYNASFLEHGKNGIVLHVRIFRALHLIHTPSGEIYVRRNCLDHKLGPDQIDNLKYLRGFKSYEDHILENVEFDLLSSSNVIYKFLLDNGYDCDPEVFLSKNALVKKNDQQFVPKVSGTLLFSDYPQPYVSRCSVKLMRYNTSSKTPQRTDLVGHAETIEGDLYSLIHQSVSRTQERIKEIPTAQDGSTVKYPHETLHEIIANAILHRDYQISEVIQIKIFNNRIEVVSPGSLPAHITRENIFEERFSRNSNLVRIINKFKNPPNQDIGEGLNTAFHAMREHGLMPPKIMVNESNVTVSILNQKIPSAEKVLISILEDHGTITETEIKRKAIFKNSPEQRKSINRMIKEGSIERFQVSGENAYKLKL